MKDELSMTIPGTPPSGNNYIRHTRQGRHYMTAEATKFQADVALLAGGQSVSGKRHGVDIQISLAPKQKGDLDNFLKVLIDSLVKAGVLKTDAGICHLRAMKKRAETAQESQTEVYVWDLDA